MLTRRLTIAGLPLVLLGCIHHFWNPRSPIQPLPEHDARRALVGVWRIELTVDSLRWFSVEPKGLMNLYTRPYDAPVIGATFELLDTLVDFDGTSLRSSLIPDPDSLPKIKLPWPGRDVSFPLVQLSTPGFTAVELHRTRVRFDFDPPGSGRCFCATGALQGDSIIGRWADVGEFGVGARGHFRMRRSSAR
jgi:hypothetical protein